MGTFPSALKELMGTMIVQLLYTYIYYRVGFSCVFCYL